MQKVGGYSALQISLHWGIAALVLFQLVFGESMETFVDAAEEGKTLTSGEYWMGSAHYWVGIAVLCLVALRLVVRLTRGVPATEPATGPSAMAAHVLHWLFYALLFIVPISGLLTFYVSDSFAGLHKLSKPVFIVLIVAHAGAALVHHVFLKDGTLRRILVPAR